MNHKFEELTTRRHNDEDRVNKSLQEFVRHVVRCILGAGKLSLTGLAALGAALPSDAQVTTRGPLVEVSLPNPLAGCNDGFVIPANMTANDSFEPYIAVNPLNRANIVAIWTGGLIQSALTAVSFDAGNSWQTVPLPFTTCAGGPWLGTTDVWVSFAPNGDCYATATVGQALDATITQMAVAKSTDGGLHWSSVYIPYAGSHGAITADPLDPHYVYLVWNGGPKKADPTVFSRSTDGGTTWEAARVIYSPGSFSQGSIGGEQICVLPDASLVAFSMLQTVQNHSGGCLQQTISIVVQRSTDHGQTWSAPVTTIPNATFYNPCSNGGYTVFDPNTGLFDIEDSGNPMFAVDSKSGNLYAVWEEGGFSNFQYNQVAFSMSSDGGLTWSAPVQVNQTPSNIPPGNRQAFLPVVAVASDGTIGVGYYDFRFNGSGPGLSTDFWLVQCHPTLIHPATDPASWGNEVRLTDSSFNFEAAFILIDHFVGDYMGLAGDGKGFIAAFNAVDGSGHTATFVRKVGQ